MLTQGGLSIEVVFKPSVHYDGKSRNGDFWHEVATA